VKESALYPRLQAETPRGGVVSQAGGVALGETGRPLMTFDTAFEGGPKVFREWLSVPMVDRTLWHALLAEAVDFARKGLAD
jgi:hypothetical protein